MSRNDLIAAIAALPLCPETGAFGFCRDGTGVYDGVAEFIFALPRGGFDCGVTDSGRLVIGCYDETYPEFDSLESADWWIRQQWGIDPTAPMFTAR